jgi:hypothetical protein
MLKDRTDKYHQEWKAKGRDVAPSEDEWYQIVETESSNQGPIFEFIGEPFKGSDWPFEARAGELLKPGIYSLRLLLQFSDWLRR